MREKTYALIVAVQEYHHKDNYSTVPYAKKDASDFADALALTGVPQENITVLIDGHATKTGIETHLTLLTDRLDKGDQGIFYFAGHGVYTSNSNFIVPVDGHKLMTANTCIGIDHIMGMFKDSHSTRNLIFLDCCHSGFRPGRVERGVSQEFEPDELLHAYRNEEYCWGFASCKSHEASISSSELRNGVWTHYLVKALKGDAENIYEAGILFSDKLQAYLKANVPEFVKMNTEDRSDQTPFCFGSMSDRFIIADLNPIFEERKMLAEVASRENKVDFTKLSMKAYESGKINHLPGFLRGHRVPDRVNPTTNNFVKSIGKSIVAQETERLSEEIAKSFNYKRKAVDVIVEDGDGSIMTPDFTFYISIRQDESDPTLYLIEKEAAEMKDPKVIQSAEFDKAFDSTFDRLVFSYSKKIDISKLIDSIEDMDDELIKVHYNRTKLDSCTIKIKDLEFEIYVEPTNLSIISNYTIRPALLVDAFKRTAKIISQYPDVLLLT